MRSTATWGSIHPLRSAETAGGAVTDPQSTEGGEKTGATDVGPVAEMWTVTTKAVDGIMHLRTESYAANGTKVSPADSIAHSQAFATTVKTDSGTNVCPFASHSADQRRNKNLKPVLIALSI